MNKTLFFALVGAAAGTGAAMLLMPRRTRNAIAYDAGQALGYAGDYASDYLPATRGPRRRKTARAAVKRKYVRRSKKAARAA